MGSETGFTRTLGFKDQSYVLRVGFNEAGAIASVELDAGEGATKGQRIAAQEIGKSITVTLNSGIGLEQLAQSFGGGERQYAVRGFEGVAAAATPHDMIMQVLNRANRVAYLAEGGVRRYGGLSVVK